MGVDWDKNKVTSNVPLLTKKTIMPHEFKSKNLVNKTAEKKYNVKNEIQKNLLDGHLKNFDKDEAE